MWSQQVTSAQPGEEVSLDNVFFWLSKSSEATESTPSSPSSDPTTIHVTPSIHVHDSPEPIIPIITPKSDTLTTEEPDSESTSVTNPGESKHEDPDVDGDGEGEGPPEDPTPAPDSKNGEELLIEKM